MGLLLGFDLRFRGPIQFFKHGSAYKKEGPDPNKGSNQQISENIRQKSKADFTVGNILSFDQYFGRHGLPSLGSYKK